MGCARQQIRECNEQQQASKKPYGNLHDSTKQTVSADETYVIVGKGLQLDIASLPLTTRDVNHYGAHMTCLLTSVRFKRSSKTDEQRDAMRASWAEVAGVLNVRDILQWVNELSRQLRICTRALCQFRAVQSVSYSSGVASPARHQTARTPSRANGCGR